MGVTLERVQNKFACIIGELSSEPYILSQFAIWVDLRIAEYKSKGAISLDCSGDKPDPSWLKGMFEPPTSEETRYSAGDGLMHSSRNVRLKQYEEYSDYPTSDTGKFDASYYEAEQDNVIAIKEEPRDIFSPGLHSNTEKKMTVKRKIDEKSDNFNRPGPAKSKRPPSAQIPSNTENQSFLSVIGVSDQPSTSSEDIDTKPITYSTSKDFENNSSLSEDGFSRLSDISALNPLVLLPGEVESHEASLWPVQGIFQQPVRQMMPYGISPMDACPLDRTTKKNTRSAVNIFQRWYSAYTNQPNVCVAMETLSPEDLDHYLELFFNTVKQNSGAEYQLKSLKLLRERLVRHLKISGYEHSIINSSLFRRSQAAFRNKKDLLKSSSANALFSLPQI